MPRSSRSKSHKQSKHSSKDATKEYSENSEEDVKMKERNVKEEKEKENSVRVSRDSVSGEKRKLPSQSRDGKDLSCYGNGDASEEYAASKRRKEKSDRWNGEEKGEDLKAGSSDKVSKSKDSSSKVVTVESKSKSSRRHDEKKEESSSAAAEKGEAKRKTDKESSSGRKEGHKQYNDSKESKDKDRERKIQDGEVARKQGEDQQSKKGRENTEWPIEEELLNPELEKELEKRIKMRGEGSSEKDKYQDDGRESDNRRLSIKGDRSKDVKHKDESHGDKYREDGERESRHREDKYRDDGDRENKSKGVKYREDGDRDNRHKDEKYCEDGDRDNRHHEDKYREDGSRDNRYKEDRYREDGDRDSRRRDDKYREGGDRVERNRDDKHRQDGDREYRHKEDKHRDDVGDSRHRDGRPRDDTDREKRVRDAKYRDISETKRLRDDNNAADLHYRKSNNREASPIYDDRVTRYKDDKDRRRGNDKEELSDFRTRSTKEQRSDAEKRSMSSAKVDSGADRGRPNSRNADMEVTVNHSRRRSSPSSSAFAARDHYRVSKQEETKYRDYAYDERVRHNVFSSRDFASATGQSDKISSYRSLEKTTQKDDGYMGESSVDRRLRSDVRASPLVDKSPSSTSNDRRHLNRPDVRWSLDVEESGQRSGNSKEAKEYSGKDGKGSRDLPMEAHLVDDLSQADGDNLSVSSPYTRNTHFPGNSKSLLPPPPPFRTGGDSSLIFAGSEDDNRGKPYNRHRRMGDPNMGRAQSGWKGVPSWPSPLANGYMPFQHGPPPVGFHPVMQQFPPPMFGVRPSMKLNHAGLPYHIPDSDRFSSHGRPLGWRNPVDDSIPPPLHGWDANNALFGDESHIYGRMDWDHSRNQLSNRGWESSDMWKGQNMGTSMDLQSAPQKDDYSARRPTDEIWSGQSGQHIENEPNQPDLQAESVNVSQSIDALDGNTPEAPKIPESPYVSKISREDDTRISQIYLSKVDISADLTQPDLYDQCSSMMDLDQTALSDEFDCKILFVEEAVEAKMKIPDSVSLFAAINDSVFQKAMSLYKKQKEEFGAINGEKVSFSNADEPDFVLASDHEKAGSDDDDMPGEEAEGAASNVNQEREETPVSNIQRLDEADVTDNLEKTEEQISTTDDVEMEVDPVLPKQEEPDFTVEEKSSPMEGLAFSCKAEEVNDSSNEISNKEHNELVLETKCGGGGVPLLFSDVSTEACEAVMPIESGSVNLSRIHHSPESTH